MDGRFSPTVDVLIPVYKPDERFAKLLEMLKGQTYEINRIIVMNTEESYWDGKRYEEAEGMEVHHLTRQEFDHGRTRNQAAGYSGAEVMIFLTDDAVPKDRFLVERLVEALGKKGPEGETVAMAYARQLPAKDCGPVERYIRNFNYPKTGKIKTLKDLPKLGIKTYFASNVCCAYRKEVFEKLGGFVSQAIFNEDMIYAAGVIDAGYGIAYVPEARVIHSHNMSFARQFCRNFDLAVSQADHPEVFGGLPSEGEGIRMVKSAMRWLLRTGQPGQIPALITGSGFKYLGYRMGKQYKKLPKAVIMKCTMNKEYWKRKWREQI